MATANDAIVTEMPNTYVSPDGHLVEMEFKNSDGTHQILRFPPSTMMIFVNKIFQLFLNEKIQKESRLGRAFVQALHAVAMFAQEDTEKEAVLLHFRLQNGIPVVFSVSPSNAEELHKQIGEAVEKTKRQS